MCACRLGACEINNNRPKKKSPQPSKNNRKQPVCESSSDWSDSESDDFSSCNGCCYTSSSSCSCSECNMETDSDSDCCCRQCPPKKKKAVKKAPAPRKRDKVLMCKDGVCDWVTKKKANVTAKTKKASKSQTKNAKPKKTQKSCYTCR